MLNLFQNPASDPNILKKYGRNLTDLALKGKLDPVIGREEEIRRIIRILSRRTKNNPVLIGEPGVGKTAIIEGLAFQIVKGEVPEILKDKEIYELNISQLISGAKFQGEFEERINAVIKKLEESDGSIIVFVDEIHTMIGTGRTTEGSLDAANIFKPLLARGEIRLIGATTISEYRKYIEKDPAFERRMQKIDVMEPTIPDTISILRGIKFKYENYHGVRIHDNAIISAANLSSRYIQDRYLPDKAIDLIDEACSMVRTQLESIPEELETNYKQLKQLQIEEKAIEKEKDLKSQQRLVKLKEEIKELKPLIETEEKKWKKELKIIHDFNDLKKRKDELETNLLQAENEGNLEMAARIKYSDLVEINEKLEKLQSRTDTISALQEVNEDTIANIVSKWTGVPVKNLVETERKRLNTLAKDLKVYIKGQDEAIELVTDVIKKARVGINDPNKPLGNFLFLGPTGVGKTELSKRLAKLLFNSEKALLRFDMSEFMEKQSVSKLIGSPPGYVGYDEGGRLTDAIRRKPYSIILFDEIEKAHPDVFNIFLQIMDDGVLTDAKGIEVNFKNTVIIMTSNIGSIEMLETKNKLSEEKIMELLTKIFRPEFINRLDEIIPFNPLKPKAINDIVKNELGYLKTRLNDKDYWFTFDDIVVAKIVENGYDPVFGARPIKRYIARHLETLISNEIIKNNVKPSVQYKMAYEDEHFIIRELKLN